ncbi:MAG: hypothetical protein CM15mP120_11690 [Pseudomonadota bacterium]|nr:MAG: hypothetical protein CM15mP120_11690 [Pseudomonadota bacterium]
MHSLNDLVESFHLYAECERCQRSVQLDIEKLIVRLGGDFPITGVRDRLRCTSCNIREPGCAHRFRRPARETGDFPIPALILGRIENFGRLQGQAKTFNADVVNLTTGNQTNLTDTQIPQNLRTNPDPSIRCVAPPPCSGRLGFSCGTPTKTSAQIN